MRQHDRNTTRVLIIGILALLLSGCIKLNMDMTVSSDNTLDGTMVFGISQQLAAMAEGQDEGMFSEGLPDDIEGVTVTPYEDEEYVGQTYTFTDVSLEEFNQSNEADTESLSILRDGDVFRVSGAMDFSDGTGQSGTETELPFDPSAMFAGADIRISLTFPGEIQSSNGEVEGTTVTWTPTFGERTEFQAVASATGSGGGMSTLLWIVLALVAVVIIGAAILLSRRKKSPAATTGPDGQPPAAGTMPPIIPGTTPPVAPGSTPPIALGTTPTDADGNRRPDDPDNPQPDDQRNWPPPSQPPA